VPAFKENGSERVIAGSGLERKSDNEGCKKGAFLTWGFFGAKLLIEEVADFLNENGGEHLIRAVGGNVDRAGVAAVATPEAGHAGRGENGDGRE
jgi:hypothetical protein